MTKHSVLILGGTGMLGHTLYRVLAGDETFEVRATARSDQARDLFPPSLREGLITAVDVENLDNLAAVLSETGPDTVINCIGLVKQLPNSADVISATSLNAILPHRLANLCRIAKARLIHFSTDCVFSGEKGDYREEDRPDPTDIYGITKLLGEATHRDTVTLRTSMIGHELMTRRGLLEWFLGQTGQVNGYSKAIFSGLPTVELASVVRNHLLPRADLHGVYHVSADAISKFELLKLVAGTYGHSVEVVPDDAVRIDRSLNSERFRAETGYSPPGWPELIEAMHKFG